MSKSKGLCLRLEVLAVSIAVLLAVSLACAAPEPTPTPVPPAPPAPPVAPVATPTTAAILTPATPTPQPLTVTPTRVLPTPTPVAVGKPVYGGHLRWGGTTDVVSLDPIARVIPDQRHLLLTLYNNLIRLQPDFSLGPELAKSWEISGDGKTITLRLQEGVKFHDGTDFDASAVKWNFDRILDPSALAQARSSFAPYVQRMEVNDKYTFTFYLKTPNRAFLPLLAINSPSSNLVSPAAVQKYGKDYGRNPVGTGAFKFVEWTIGQRVVMQRNDNYWEKGLPYLDRITFLMVPDNSVRVAMLRTGDIDYEGDVNSRLVPILEGNSRLKVVGSKSCLMLALKMRLSRPPWNNLALRQALAYSINRPQIIQNLELGQARPGYSPEGDCFWWSNPGLKVYDLDLAKAKEKLKEAGFPNGINVDFWAGASAPQVQEAEFYQAMLKDAGFRLNIILVPAGDTANLSVPPILGGPGIIHFGVDTWSPRPDPDGRLRLLFHSDGASNRMEYYNPQLDKLIDEAVTVYDQAQAKKLYDQIQKIIVENVAGELPTHFRTQFAAMDRKLQGYQYYADIIARLREFWLEK